MGCQLTNNTSFYSTLIPSSSPSCVSVSLCIFLLISSSVDGGGIQMKTSGFVLNVWDSSFLNCSCGLNTGGAIYFKDSLGKTTIVSTCAQHCTAAAGSFFFINSNSDSYSNMNSFSYCSKDISLANKYNSWYHEGNVKIENLNCSKNACGYQISGLLFWYCNNIEVLYSTLAQNQAGTYVIIDAESITGENKMNNINFISNSQLSTTFALILFLLNSNPGTISHSVFKLNQNTIFHAQSTSLTVSFSRFDTLSGNAQTVNCVTNVDPTIIPINVVYDQMCQRIIAKTSILTRTPRILFVLQALTFND